MLTCTIFTSLESKEFDVTPQTYGGLANCYERENPTQWNEK